MFVLLLRRKEELGRPRTGSDPTQASSPFHLAYQNPSRLPTEQV